MSLNLNGPCKEQYVCCSSCAGERPALGMERNGRYFPDEFFNGIVLNKIIVFWYKSIYA